MADKLPMDFGNYMLLELVARGGMAEIYRAQMRTGIDGFEKSVAIKKILPNLAENDDFITMLIDEARISVTMNHANIAQVYDLGRVGESYYIAMEYIPGLDLSTMIKKLGKEGYLLPLDHAIFITKELCAGLYYAHSKKDERGNPLNIVHRDISPHNVLVSFNGNVKVIDFGVAKASVKLGQTRMGVIKGKLLYMAPEQAMAKAIDCRADIFSAGLCLYRMLTGHLPFEADNEFQIYNNVLTAPIIPPRQLNTDIPEDLNRIVMKSLERDVNQRYADAWLMHQDLEQILHRVSPGYTAQRMMQFMNEYFSDMMPQALSKAETSAPMKPSYPSAPSAPSVPSMQSGNYNPASAGPDTPSRWPQVPQPVAVASPSGPSARDMMMGGPTVPISRADLGDLPDPAALLPSPEELGFKARTPEVLEDHGYDADPTVDMQLDPAALQKMAAARGRPVPQKTQQVTPNKPQIRTTGNAAPEPASGGSKLPIILLGVGAVVFLLVAAGVAGFWYFTQDEDPAPTPDPTPVVKPDPEATPTEEPKGEPPTPAPTGELGPALEKARPVVAQALADAGERYSAEVTLTITSDPEGAGVTLKRKPLGTTPLTIQVPRSEDPMELVFSLDGHERASVEVVPSTNRDTSITLKKGESGSAEGDKKGGGAGDKKDGKDGKKGDLLDPW